MVAYTSAKKFNVEPPMAMLLAGILLYPGWEALVSAGAEAGETFTSYFGIPIYLCTYGSSVIPIVLSVWIMSKVDGLLKRIIPNTIRYFLKPVCLIFIMSIITLSITGPLGYLITDYIAAGINFIRETAPWLTVPAIYLFSMTLGVFCPGFHLALIPIATANFATLGSSPAPPFRDLPHFGSPSKQRVSKDATSASLPLSPHYLAVSPSQRLTVSCIRFRFCI